MDSRAKKVVGSFKDLASMGLAKLNSKNPEIDIAVVKATRHDDIPPKEKHVLAALAATETSGLRRDLRHQIELRLTRTKSWIVALKTLLLIHRLMRDGFTIFTQDDLQHPSHVKILVGISQHFEDRSSPVALECSLWVRKYSGYLAQRLHCNRLLDYDVVAHDYDVVARENHSNRTKELETGEFFKYSPFLQQLLNCLIECTPQEGCVAMNPVIQYALHLILKECPHIYGTINSCLHKLVHLFSGMPTDKALRFLEIYKRNMQQYERLSNFYDACSEVVLTHGHDNFSALDKPPVSFFSEMEIE